MTTKNIIKKADQLYNGMEWLKLDEDNGRVIIKDEEKIGEKLHQELLDLTFKVSEETQLSMDSVYGFTQNALVFISDSTADNEDDLREAGYEIEADSYTGQLTGWLAQNNNHVYYLGEAISEYGASDGFQALAVAQQQAKQEVFNIVLDYIVKGGDN